jgi:hypothetical protein
MYDDDLEVLFITEPHLSDVKQRTVQQVFSEFDVFISRSKVKRNKQYQQRGGILCIARKNTVKLERKCEFDDMLWIDWKGIKVAGVYFVPSTSPFAKRNVKNERIATESIRSKRNSDDIHRCERVDRQHTLCDHKTR